MDYQMQRKLNTFFGLEKIMDFQLINVNFIEMPKVRKMRSSIRRQYKDFQFRGAHLHMGEMDVHRSMIKRKIDMNHIIEDPRISLRIAPSQAGLHHTTMWKFLKRELELQHTSYRGMNKSIIWTSRIGLCLQDIVEVSYKIIQNSSRRMKLSDEWEFSPLWIFQLEKLSRKGLRTSKRGLSRAKTRTICHSLVHHIEKGVIWPYFFENKKYDKRD